MKLSKRIKQIGIKMKNKNKWFSENNCFAYIDGKMMSRGIFVDESVGSERLCVKISYVR